MPLMENKAEEKGKRLMEMIPEKHRADIVGRRKRTNKMLQFGYM
jgi:hypothetical protein